MVRQAVSATYYMFVASVIIGCLVSSLLSPIASIFVDVPATSFDGDTQPSRYELRVYGLMVSYHEPPPGGPSRPDPDPTSLPSSEDDSAAISSSSAEGSSISSRGDSSTQLSSSSGELQGFSLFADGVPWSSRTDVFTGARPAPVPSKPAATATTTITRRGIQRGRLGRRLHGNRAVVFSSPLIPGSGERIIIMGGGAAMPLTTDLSLIKPAALAGASEDSLSSSSSAGDSTPLPAGQVRRVYYLHRIPFRSLKRCCIAYVAFLAITLLCCVALIVMSVLQAFVVFVDWRHAMNATRITFLFTVLTGVVCMGTAAALARQSNFYSEIAGGFYVPGPGVSQLTRSGLSCSAAAAGIGVVAAVGLPFM